MKNLYKTMSIVAAIFSLTSCGNNENTMSSTSADNRSISAAESLATALKVLGPEKFTASDYNPGIVRHIVLFRYKDNVTDAERQEITNRFLALQKSTRNGMRYILSIDEGLQSSGEKADRGLEQGFLVTFRSEGDRNYYVGQPIIQDSRYYDPAHQQFKDFVGQYLAPQGVLVFDYKVVQSTP